MQLPDSPQEFYKIIPTDVRANILFRIELHKLLATDEKFQNLFLEMCRQYYPIFFSSVAWTLNPQKPPGERNQPFIPRPAQLPAIERLVRCIDEGRDVGIDKTRKQGASEICCKVFTAKCLLETNAHFILGSRKKELVDNFGDPYTLFAKVDNVLECLPSWWKLRCGYDPKNNRKDMNIVIPETNSSMNGETTNESFSAGSRATAILLDEFGRVDYTVAEAIEGSVHDVCNCVVYSSTHWLGINHTFNKCLQKSTTDVIKLMWYDNPEERQGLYKTSEPGIIELVDIDYYSKWYPTLLSKGTTIQVSTLPSELQRLFVADGLRGVPSPVRSPWFDGQEKKRKGNRRDFICNVCAVPLGASDAPFDAEVLENIRKTTIRPPDYEGELVFDYENNVVSEHDIKFLEQYGQNRLKWWGSLPFDRPDQKHNYIVGIDPSYGLGSSNSVIAVYDVNTKELCGIWADSTTDPIQLADITVALAYWCGGVTPTFIIWECNGGHGSNFTNRLVYNGYPWLYTQRREDSKTRKQTQKYGWSSNEIVKERLLGELGVALSEGLTEKPDWKAIIIHDENLLDELSDYVFKERGKGIVASSKADLSTGALERHGDRVIATALCILGTREQVEGNFKDIVLPPPTSFMGRMKRWEQEQEQLKRNSRQFLY